MASPPLTSMESKLHLEWDPSAKALQNSYKYSTLPVLLQQTEEWISSLIPYYCKSPNRHYRKKPQIAKWDVDSERDKLLDRLLTFPFGSVPNQEQRK